LRQKLQKLQSTSEPKTTSVEPLVEGVNMFTETASWDTHTFLYGIALNSVGILPLVDTVEVDDIKIEPHIFKKDDTK
jgi:hypothetical protein